MSFPTERPRRLRRTRAAARHGARDARSARRNLIYPLFVVPGEGVRREIPSLPGCFHLSVGRGGARGRGGRAPRDRGRDPLRPARRQGPRGLRGLRRRRRRAAGRPRDPRRPAASCWWSPTSACASTPPTATAASSTDGEVQNDPTLRAARADGRLATPRPAPHIVAPSDMMDGRVGAIREALDERGLRRHCPSSPTPPSTPRPSTAPSARRPTRAPQFGDRRGYQMDPANVREALREVRARHRGGRRHRDGEARAPLPRRHPRGAPRRFDLPGGRLQRLRRVRHGQGRGGAGAGSTRTAIDARRS